MAIPMKQVVQRPSCLSRKLKINELGFSKNLLRLLPWQGPLPVTDGSGLVGLIRSNRRYSINDESTPGTIPHPEDGQDRQTHSFMELVP